ncbi:Serine threonine-kinase CTR1 [Micractinium conductrix]|uniref:Serine threonine-kinase CTR1 n=1 Tax=Micractinium conductrix TaxID=554055 RepID=A0A2P6VFC3_9CHLO|nr:Serine threonine-kinase CTR1 [Micractinium conductrix]|eukprot:PSC72792.1 Serine threonine-kinase CTR1 [Micractinium conductrix]
MPGLAPTGTMLGAAADNVVASAGDCCRACRANKRCTAMWFCEAQGGCASAAHNLSVPYGGCQLVEQVATRPGTGRPVLVVPAPGFIGGAPLRHPAPAIEEYDVWPGLGYWYRYDLECGDSVSQPGSCGLRGGPQGSAARCDADPDCQVMMYFPEGRDYPGAGQPVVLLKGSTDVQMGIQGANINLNAVLYKKRAAALPGTAGGGLSAGAIAGIAVGAVCAAALLLAAGVWLARRRRRPEGRPTSVEPKPSSSGSSSGCGGDAQSKDLLPSPPGSGEPVLIGGRVVSMSQVPSQLLPFHPAAAAAAPSVASSGSAPLSTAAAQLPPGLDRSPLGMPPAMRAAPATPAEQSLLSHLPVYGWQRSIVDFSKIQFHVGPGGAIQELGSGSSATVYRVVLDGVDPHAAKVFRLGADPEAQLYFLEEASLLRLLRHPCVVGFAGVCVTDGNGIILMELMEGGDLRTRNRDVDADGRRVFGWYQRGRTVALDVACALNYLHSSTYTHFDVKARNVLLSRDLTAKLADVGFARAMRATHHSIEGPTGTFDYMAPELLTGRKCNNSVDVYSFGVLLWELCVGEYPARGTMRESRVPQECPQAVAQLMTECLQENPMLRPSAAQLVERLTLLQ